MINANQFDFFFLLIYDFFKNIIISMQFQVYIYI